MVKHSLEELENSDLFKYSPYKELNDDQRVVVEEIIESLKKEENQTIVVNGMPGSGKTIVAIFLLKFLRDSDEFRDKKIGLVIPQTSLRKTLRGIFKSIYKLKASDVLSPADVTKNYYDILLVDEAHRLHQCDSPILFYDELQVVGPSGIDIERFSRKMKNDGIKRLTSYYNLLTQMRVNGGNDYISYVKDILSGKITEKRTFANYELKLVMEFDTFN